MRPRDPSYLLDILEAAKLARDFIKDADIRAFQGWFDAWPASFDKLRMRLRQAQDEASTSSG